MRILRGYFKLGELTYFKLGELGISTPWGERRSDVARRVALMYEACGRGTA
jgi:hypothetical protein